MSEKQIDPVSSGTPTVDLPAIKAELNALATLDNPDELMLFVDHCEALIAEVERLRAALSALSGQTAPQGWEPIATAKEGRNVLVSVLENGKRWTTVAMFHRAGTLDMDCDDEGLVDEEGRNPTDG